MKLLTVDACVFTSRFEESEAGHLEASRFFEAAKRGGVAMLAPTLLLPEVCSAIARSKRNPRRGESVAIQLRTDLSLKLIDIDLALSDLAARFAIRHKLRGGDAIYLAVARASKTMLISNDSQLIVAANDAGVLAKTPRAWLASAI